MFRAARVVLLPLVPMIVGCLPSQRSTLALKRDLGPPEPPPDPPAPEPPELDPAPPVLAEPPKALPALALTNERDMQLFSMSPAQSREFPRVATGGNLSSYTAFVAGVRQWRADHDGPVLRRSGFPAAQVTAWVDAMRDPETATDVRVGQFAGHVEPTTDTAHRVNGACRAMDAAGTEWDCYLGQAAVSAGVISPAALGAPMLAGPTGDL